MKALAVFLLIFILEKTIAQPAPQTQNIFIITLDGYRWQEVFGGADEALLSNPQYVGDTALLKQLYWSNDTSERRKQLMPFFWNVIARKGQLYGNRRYDNKVNVKNIYKFSYPGYNEIFTGFASLKFVPNTPVPNRNTNILEWLNKQEDYKGRVVAFTSWSIFPYILNEHRSDLVMNSGYQLNSESDTNQVFQLINKVQEDVVEKKHTRYDELTYLSAREYIKGNHPKVAFIGLGETDEFAHENQYDQYLNAANKADRMIAELWYYVQSDPFYKNNTTFIITTDHGRGSKARTWHEHNTFIKGSGEVWMALLGPGILPMGEMKTDEQLYQKQIASTIAMLLGQKFESEHTVGEPVNLPGIQVNNVAVLNNGK